MRDEFVQRMRAAARGEDRDQPTPLDAHLRALVKQLGGGAAAPTTNRHSIVGGKLPKPRR